MSEFLRNYDALSREQREEFIGRVCTQAA
jgi:hypothetical protein